MKNDEERKISIDYISPVSNHESQFKLERIKAADEVNSFVFVVLGALAIGIILYLLQDMIIPFVFALFLKYMLQPVVDFLHSPPRKIIDQCCSRGNDACCGSYCTMQWFFMKNSNSRSPPDSASRQNVSYGSITDEPTSDSNDSSKSSLLDKPWIPRWFAAVLTIWLVWFIMALFGHLVYLSIVELETHSARYVEGSKIFSQELSGWINKIYPNKTVNIDLRHLLQSQISAISPLLLDVLLESIRNFIFIFILLFYMLLWSSDTSSNNLSWLRNVEKDVKNYIRIKTFICIIVGLMAGSILSLLNVDLAWMIGLLSFLLNYIPNFGPIVASFLPLPLVILDPDMPVANAVMAIMIPGFFHGVIGTFVEPLIFGDSLTLHPVIVLLSLAFWGILWNVAGLVLSIPLLATTRILLRHGSGNSLAIKMAMVLEGKLTECFKED